MRLFASKHVEGTVQSPKEALENSVREQSRYPQISRCASPT